MMACPLTLASILDRAQRWFGAVEIVAGTERATYAGLAVRARALAAGLAASGLAPGDRVATLLWNDLPHLAAYFGVPLAGGIVHPLNLRQHPQQWAAILRQAGDRFALVDERLLDRWRELPASALPERVFVVPRDDERLLAAGPAASLPVLAEESGAAMGYTSGTTGEPKGVVYSHRALCLHALAIALPDALNLRQRDCILSLVPMFHANAWGTRHAGALIGCKHVLAGAHWDAESALDLL
ncbi:MAG: AMP-binding protein, partial [Terriglobales bacterium]